MGYVDEVLADSPVVYYRMGEASGNPQDFSGNGRHIDTVNGTPVYSVAGAIADGNTAINFDTNVNMSTPDHAVLDLGDVFTMECWVKLNNFPGASATYGLISKQTGAYYFRIKHTAANLNLVRSQTADIVTGTSGIPDTTNFHHCVATKDGATCKLYRNGVDVTGTVTNSTCVNNTNALRLGDDLGSGSEDADCVIDEVAVYATALSQARVQVHYNAAFEQINFLSFQPHLRW